MISQSLHTEPFATPTASTRPTPEPATTLWEQALQGDDDQIVHTARLAALGEIAAGVVHEINQPLAAIRMIVTSMLADLEGGALPADRAQQWLETVNGQIARISWITDHLRSFTRNEAPGDSALASLRDVVDNTLGLLRSQLRSHGVTVEVAMEQGPCTVHGDLRRLEQVLVNLLSNARDALGTLPNSAPKTISIRAHTDRAHGVVVLEVADNGPGMPEQVRERIFNPFFTTKGTGKGTGLGLSIVHTILSECGGGISVESAPGAGTTFRIELPAAQDAPANTA